MSTRLETARLIIRSYEQRDVDRWIALVSNPDVRRHLPPAPPPTTETFLAALERRHALERERGHAEAAAAVSHTFWDSSGSTVSSRSSSPRTSARCASRRSSGCDTRAWRTTTA